MFDIHCHILPEVDDGSSSLKESLEMLHIAVEEGIQVISATHHFIDENQTIEEYITLWNRSYDELQLACKPQLSKVRIIKGAEVMISPFLIKLDGLDRLCINDSRYLLLELPMMDIPQYTEDVIYNLRLKGLIPIIAHPERNRRIKSNPNLLLPFILLGALVQINAGSLTGLYGKSARRCARILVRHNMVHIMGTDAHSSEKRSPRMKEPARLLQKWVGRQLANSILYENPKAILNDHLLE